MFIDECVVGSLDEFAANPVPRSPTPGFHRRSTQRRTYPSVPPPLEEIAFLYLPQKMRTEEEVNGQ